MSSYEIPREEVERMKPEDFIETYTYHFSIYYPSIEWIQYNKMVDGAGGLRGLKVWRDGRVDYTGWWPYGLRDGKSGKHYRTLEDLVQDCDDEVLLDLFMKERCQ